MRVLYKDKKCLVCNTELKKVLVTKSALNPFQSYELKEPTPNPEPVLYVLPFLLPSVLAPTDSPEFSTLAGTVVRYAMGIVLR